MVTCCGIFHQLKSKKNQLPYDKQYNVEVMCNSFHLDGHILGFCPRIPRLQLLSAAE